jgi:hypothetical protein
MPAITVDPIRLQELLNYCLSFGRHMLANSGQFYPFGAVVDQNGKLSGVGGNTGEEHPKVADVFRLLRDGMRTQFAERSIVAAAIAINVDMPPEFNSPHPTAIRILLECANYARIVYVPYRGTGDALEFGDLIPVEAPPTLCGCAL